MQDRSFAETASQEDRCYGYKIDISVLKVNTNTEITQDLAQESISAGRIVEKEKEKVAVVELKVIQGGALTSQRQVEGYRSGPSVAETGRGRDGIKMLLGRSFPEICSLELKNMKIGRRDVEMS